MSEQTAFATALLNPQRPAPDGLLDHLNQPAGRRFEVYRNNVAVALGEALAASFPIIRKLLGDENFKAIAGVYLRQFPPDSPVMSQYGQGFPEFLQDFPPLQHLGYLHDVARLEHLIRQAYHAADATAIDPQFLQQIAPEDLPLASLSLAPALQLVPSNWPLFDIWYFNTHADAAKPGAAAQDVAIFRPEFDPIPVALPAGGHGFLADLRQGACLQDASNAALQQHPGFDLSHLLGLLLAQGAITDIHIKFHMR